MSPSARGLEARGRSIRLCQSEEWERQEQRLGLFAWCTPFNERTKRCGFSPRTEPPTDALSCIALTRSGRLLFDDLHRLIFADLVTLVAASSDLTSLQQETP